MSPPDPRSKPVTIRASGGIRRSVHAWSECMNDVPCNKLHVGALYGDLQCQQHPSRKPKRHHRRQSCALCKPLSMQRRSWTAFAPAGSWACAARRSTRPSGTASPASGWVPRHQAGCLHARAHAVHLPLSACCWHPALDRSAVPTCCRARTRRGSPAPSTGCLATADGTAAAAVDVAPPAHGDSASPAAAAAVVERAPTRHRDTQRHGGKGAAARDHRCQCAGAVPASRRALHALHRRVHL